MSMVFEFAVLLGVRTTSAEVFAQDVAQPGNDEKGVPAVSDGKGDLTAPNGVAGADGANAHADQSGSGSAGTESAASPQQNSPSQTSAQQTTTQNPPQDHVLEGNFFQRLAQFYRQDWADTNPAAPAAKKRGLPALLDSPPFPSSDWRYGGANGAFCRAGVLRCNAPEYAIVSYVNRSINRRFFVGFRSDLLDDKKGQRTGFATKYTENTLYATKYIGSTWMLRPELRFDHSWDLAAYNGGKARNQLFFGMDLIYKF